MNRKILIFGATSAIAQETAKIFCDESTWFCLVGRSDQKLQSVKNDLLARGAGQASCEQLNLDGNVSPETLREKIIEGFGLPDVILVAWGDLPDQKHCEDDYTEFEKTFRVNFLSVVMVLTPFINILKDKGSGVIAVISSVAGDRGRQSNFAYGSAKGALNRWLQGLRNALWHSGVHVLTIKPGFIDTPMTGDITKGPLFVKPEFIAPAIKKAILKKRNEIYVPGFWMVIMSLVCLIPESLFKRLKL